MSLTMCTYADAYVGTLVGAPVVAAQVPVAPMELMTPVMRG